MKPNAKKTVTQLHDLLVEEVSIVDRPANKRPFLLVKNADGHGAEVVPGANGNLETAPTTPPTSTDSVVNPKILAGLEQMWGRIEKALTVTPEIRRDLFRDLGDAQRRIGAVMCLADFAPTDYDNKEASDLVPLFAKELAEAAALITDVSKRLSKISKNAPPEPSPAEDFKKGLETIAGGIELIEKRGAKMSSARLGKFKNAMSALSALLSELETVTDSAPAPGRMAKAEGDEVVEKALTAAAVGIDRLTETVKKQARQIHDLRNARPAGNAAQVEREAPPPPSTEVHWPRDLNAKR